MGRQTMMIVAVLAWQALGQAILLESFSGSGPLSEIGFMDNSYWTIDTSAGCMKTVSPGDWCCLSSINTRQFFIDPVTQSYVSEWSLQFPTQYGPSWRENNKLWVSFCDSLKNPVYTVLFKPNRPEDRYTSSDLQLFRHTGQTESMLKEVWTHSLTPHGYSGLFVRFRVELMPAATAGSLPRLLVYYDARDGRGYQKYIDVADSVGKRFSMLNFRYKTGTGTSRYFIRVDDLVVNPSPLEFGQSTRADSDADSIPDHIEIELGHSPTNQNDFPKVTIPLKWDAEGELFMRDVTMRYSSPLGDHFDVLYPANSIESEYVPFVEFLDSIPATTQFTVPPGEAVLSSYRFHGRLRNGQSVEFPFQFQRPGQPIGSASVQMYGYDELSKVWNRLELLDVSDAMAITMVDQELLCVLTIRDDVLLVDHTSLCSNGDCDGKSWKTSFRTIEEALTVAGNGNEIWIAKGSYTPYKETFDRCASYVLKDGVKLMGGFAGFETHYLRRDYIKNKTILDGKDYIFTLVKGAHNNYLDGVHIRAANSAIGGAEDVCGPISSGAVLVGPGYFEMKNCVVEDNLNGGIVGESAHIRLTKCIFRNNSLITIDVVGHGGAISCVGGAVNASECIFIENRESSAIYLSNTATTFINSVFAHNSSSYDGVVEIDGNTASIANCTFYDNTSIQTWGASLYLLNSNAELANSIFWRSAQNRRTLISSGQTINIDNCNIMAGVDGELCSFANGYTGLNNIGDDETMHAPAFVKASNPAGDDGIFWTYDDGLSLKRGSPCFNAGKDGLGIPKTDIVGNGGSRAEGELNAELLPDIGAYWLFVSENQTYPGADFLRHKDHHWGFDRITKVNTYYYAIPEDAAKLLPDDIFLSMAFDGQGTDVPNNGFLNVVISPSAALSGKIAVADPSTSLLKIRKDDGTMVSEMAWPDRNIFTVEIVAGNRPSQAPNPVVNQVQVIDATGSILRKLDVVIYTQKNKSASFYRVYDNRYPQTIPPRAGTVAEIESEVNKIYSQAVTTFSLAGADDLNIPFDLNGNGALDYYIKSNYMFSYSKGGNAYPGLTMERSEPELSQITSITSRGGNVAILAGRRFFNWVVVPNPYTGNTPKTGDLEIYVYDADESFQDVKIRGTAYLGHSGDKTTSEAIYVKDIAWAQPAVERTWKVTLDKPLANVHGTSISNGSIVGPTLWKPQPEGKGGIAQYDQYCELYDGSYVSIAHELAHSVFGMGHYQCADLSAGQTGFVFNSMKNMHNRNLMNTHGGVWLNKRPLRAVGSYGDRFYSQWDYINNFE